MSETSKQYIVTLGASAGGLEAIQEFFDHIPPGQENLSFVVIQHLSPDHKSLLVELLGRRTRLKVLEAAHNMPVSKNCIYVIPNNKLIRIQHNKLLLSAKEHDKVPNNAIDVFLHALAADKREHAIAVILSGTGTDGTKGIASIKEHGGQVFVQEPATARFDGMPNTAIASGYADVVNSPAGLAEAVISSTQPLVAPLQMNEADDEQLSRIYDLVSKHAGQNFRYYKTPTILRRIHKKMFQHGFTDMRDYVDFLAEHPAECQELAQDFLINVTRFFRDPDAFDILRNQVVPDLLEGKAPGEQLKVWVAACSTGEEAYSIALVIDEVLEQLNKRVEVKIFASDVDAASLDVASIGQYPFDIEKDVPAPMLEKYFTRKNKGYVISQRIRKQIVFARHDISRDPPFIKNDLVSCRNMLIYMNNVLQERIYSILQFSLNTGGYLFLGPSENPPFTKSSGAAMQQLSMKWKIFRKHAETRHRIHFNEHLPLMSRNYRDGNGAVAMEPAVTARGQKELWGDLRTVLTEELGMVGFYIDQQFEVHETIGNYDTLLTLPKKNLNLNLVRMLPQGLAVVLNREVRRAWKSGKSVSVNDVVFGKKEQARMVNIFVKPPSATSGHDFTLVLLTKAPVHHENGHAPAPDQENGENGDLDYVRSLETELAEARSSLSLAVEDLETANEELQSSNEELLSSNEELQSSNEELQSLNEELYTLNTEHQLKIKELSELNDDLNNYFRSTDIAQIFLDTELNVRKFNPASARMINLIESDLGRPIAHISGNLRYDRLMEDIQHVKQTRDVVEKEVTLNKDRNFLLRIMPYITRDGKYAGIIITFVDISTITTLNNIIRSVFNATSSAILALKSVSDTPGVISDFRVEAANERAQQLFAGGRLLEGKLLKENVPALATAELFREYVELVLDRAELHHDVFIDHREEWFEVTGAKMPGGLVVTFTDITEKKKAVQKVRKSYSELNEVKENLRKLNAELEDKVRARTRELSSSEERFRLVARATNDALWDWDLTQDQIWRSESFMKMFGFDQSSMTRKEWIEHVHPDERKQLENSIHAAIHDSHSQWSSEYRFRKADGEYAYVLDRGYILQNEFGVPYRMLGSMLDLSALRKAEEELAQNVAEKNFLAESMPLIVWTAGPDGKVDFVNKQFVSYTGISLENALGEGWQEMIHPEDLPRLNATWKEAVSKQKDFDAEVRIRMSENGYRWNLLRAKARLDASKVLSGWVVSNTDVHEQKVMNEVLEEKVNQRTHELQEINQALERSNRDLQLFASVASHDLQEPLRKIHMFSKLVKDRNVDNLPAESHLYLGKIMNSAVRMKSLVNNILQFSKLADNRAGFEKTDIRQVMLDICEDFEVIIREKDAKVTLGEMPELWVNKSYIQQVFQNLISNALKFGRKDVAPEITVTATLVRERAFDAEEDKNGNWCLIKVTDNGIGFDEQYKNRIFDLFQRLNSKDKYEGTGIGLAIVKKIIETHNGLIAAESREGEGATFSIILPRHRPQ